MKATLNRRNIQSLGDKNKLISQMQDMISSLVQTEREEFEERASIMEFEGGLSREEADWRALRIVIENRLKIAV